MSQDTWDDYWMGMAQYVSTKSKDRSRKVGTVFVINNDLISIGWNGLPRGINDDIEDRHIRPKKYKFYEHSEKNAINNCSRLGRSTLGCTSYQTLYPCGPCSLSVIQAGIKEIVTFEPDWNDLTYAADFLLSKELLEEAGVKVRFMDGNSPERR